MLRCCWRQDKCHFFELHHDINNSDGLWTTDWGTPPESLRISDFFLSKATVC